MKKHTYLISFTADNLSFGGITIQTKRKLNQYDPDIILELIKEQHKGIEKVVILNIHHWGKHE